MKNPILSGAGYKYYLLIWVLLMLIHGLILYFYYQYPLDIAIGDSLVHNLIFGAIAPGLWYIVKFANSSKDELSLITTHLLAAGLTIFFWTTLATFLVKTLFKGEDAYLIFVDEVYLWRLVIGTMYYCISILIFYLIKYYLDMQERAHRELELKALLQNAELRMLKSQINPHFIFNSLNSISALTITKPEAAREMVIKLSNFLRYSLGKDSIQMNSLKEEIENISHYMDIEKVRFGKKLTFIKDVSEASLRIQVPNLILQPIFENAIKYGVYESLGNETITLKSHLKEDILVLAIVNTFDPTASAPKGEGIGIENVKKRLQLVYQNKATASFKTVDHTFVVHLQLPSNLLPHASN